LLALRHHAEARTDLLRSYHLTANGGAWDELAEVTRLLGDCHRALGQRHFAGHYFAAALAVVEQVAGAIADPAARCTFVNDPRRQALFAAIREFREGQA
jgi:hypothetical protein